MKKQKQWIPAKAWKAATANSVWKMPLADLLKIVDSLFYTCEDPYISSYNYSIGRMPYGWNFRVINSWYKWSARKRKYEFGFYDRPEYAIAAFLEYVIKNKIQPHKLSDMSNRPKKKRKT